MREDFRIQLGVSGTCGSNSQDTSKFFEKKLSRFINYNGILINVNTYIIDLKY